MTSSGRKWNLPKVNFLLDFFVFISFLLAIDPRSTGISIHEWLSIACSAAIVTHLVLHWDWTVAVVKRFFRSASERIGSSWWWILSSLSRASSSCCPAC